MHFKDKAELRKAKKLYSKKPKKMYNRCMGDCCEDIALKVSPEELEASYRRWLGLIRYNKAYQLQKSSHEVPVVIWEDIHVIFPMLVFVKKDRTHPEFPYRESERDLYHYICKHYDKKKGSCTIYSHRPSMCVTYPNKDYCGNPKCRNRMLVKKRDQLLKEAEQNFIREKAGWKTTKEDVAMEELCKKE